MKQLIIILTALLLLPVTVMAQYEEDTENGVVSLSGKEGFSIATKKGDFLFKPYMLVQTSANINYYDDWILPIIKTTYTTVVFPFRMQF